MMMEIIANSLILALLMLLFFLLGMYVSARTTEKSRQEADYEYRKLMAYNLAGVERPGDPVPYVAPPEKRRRRIPHMKEIEQRLRNGERSTVKVEDDDNI